MKLENIYYVIFIIVGFCSFVGSIYFVVNFMLKIIENKITNYDKQLKDYIKIIFFEYYTPLQSQIKDLQHSVRDLRIILRKKYD